MNTKTIISNLNKNVDIIESTFERANLQVISYGFCGIQEDSGWMQFLVEIASLNGSKLNSSVDVKVNLYDENNTIIYSYDEYIDEDDFMGYDTIHMYLNEDNLAFEAMKARLYATQS